MYNEVRTLNFYDRKFKKIMSVTILVLIVAMVATSVVPYLV